MLPLPFRIALAIHLALNAASAIAGPEHVMFIDPLSPLAEISQLGVLLVAAIVVHDIADAIGPKVKQSWLAFLQCWKRRWNRR